MIISVSAVLFIDIHTKSMYISTLFHKKDVFMDGQDLTKGSIPKQLWTLSWPMMLTMFFYTLYNLVDSYWVGKISSEAFAAVGLSQISLFVMISLGFGITVGSGVIMAMHIGAKEKDEAERVLGQSFVLSALLAVFFTVLSLTFREEFLTMSGASGTIFNPAMDYFTIVSSGSVLLFVMMAIMLAYNSQGDTATLTKLFALSTAINMILDPILIFGWGGFPSLGISGAAYATLVSQSVFIGVAVWSLSRETRMIRFRFKHLGIKWESVKRVLNIGFPAALTQVIFPLGLAIVANIISLSFAEEGAIAFNVGFRIEFFAFLPAAGFGMGVMALIGQNMGAGNATRTIESFNTAVKYTFLSATGLGVIAALFSEPIIYLFTDNPQAVDYAKTYIYSVTLSYGFLATLMVEANSFQSIDKAWPGFWLFLLRVGGIMIPLCYILTNVYKLPIQYVWFSVITANVISSVVGYIWIKGNLVSLLNNSRTEVSVEPTVEPDSVS